MSLIRFTIQRAGSPFHISLDQNDGLFTASVLTRQDNEPKCENFVAFKCLLLPYIQVIDQKAYKHNQTRTTGSVKYEQQEGATF